MDKFQKLFDMLTYLNEGAKGDYILKGKEGQVSLSPKKVQAFVAKQIHAFGISAATRLGDTKAVQAFTGSTDISKITTNVWNATQDLLNTDAGWQMAFRPVPLRKGQLEWSLGVVSSGVVFKLLDEGQKVEYAGIEGSVAKGEVELYGGGLELSWKTLEGRDLAGFFNAMLEFRNKRSTKYADVHYGLLNTAGALNPIDYQLTTNESQLERDIATINEAAFTIGNACKDKGYGDTANARILCYGNPKLKGRVGRALRATTQDTIRSGAKYPSTVDYTIEYISTFNSQITSNKLLFVLPGNKIQNSVYMQSKSFERTNPDNLSWLKSEFTAFGAIVGDTAQCALADMAD